MAGAEYGANSIGTAYHNNSFSNNNFVNKATQLTLHAGLGAVSSKLTGGDYLSGAVSGVVGEVAGEYFRDNGFNKQDGSDLAGLMSGLSAIIVARSEGKDVSDIGNEAYAGQRVGKNASENNAYLAQRRLKGIAGIAYYLTPDLQSLNDKNIEPEHEQFFFEDNIGGNLGFFDDNTVRSDDDKNLKLYSISNDPLTVIYKKEKIIESKDLNNIGFTWNKVLAVIVG